MTRPDHRPADDGSGSCLSCGKPVRAYQGRLEHRRGRVAGVSPYRLNAQPVAADGYQQPIAIAEPASPRETLRYAHVRYDLWFLDESIEDHQPIGTPGKGPALWTGHRRRLDLA